MKECFHSFNLKTEYASKKSTYDFKTEIDNDAVHAVVTVEHRPNLNCVNINFSFGVIESSNFAELKRLLNLMNETVSFCQFSLCPCCNEVIMHASLFVPNNKLPKDKFTWLLRYLLEAAHLAYPAVGQVGLAGGDPDKHCDIYKDSLRSITHQEEGLDQETAEKVLNGCSSVCESLNIIIQDENRMETVFSSYVSIRMMTVY